MPAPAGMLFLDVSSLQGVIDWKAVAAWRSPDGRRIVGVIARAANGDSPDRRHPEYRAGAKAAGLKFGSYGVLYPAGDVGAQARSFLAIVGKVEDDELPPSLDFEVKGLGQEHDAALRWLAVVEPATGRQATVYTGWGFTTGITWPKDSKLAERPLWVAHYTSSAHPLVPSQWSGRFAVWQYSGNGGERVAGCATDIDRDTFVEDVDGDGDVDELDVDAFIARSFLVPRPAQTGPVEVPRASSPDPAPLGTAAMEAA